MPVRSRLAERGGSDKAHTTIDCLEVGQNAVRLPDTEGLEGSGATAAGRHREAALPAQQCVERNRLGQRDDVVRQVVGRAGNGPAFPLRAVEPKRHGTLQLAHYRPIELVVEHLADGHGDLAIGMQVEAIRHVGVAGRQAYDSSAERQCAKTGSQRLTSFGHTNRRYASGASRPGGNQCHEALGPAVSGSPWSDTFIIGKAGGKIALRGALEPAASGAR